RITKRPGRVDRIFIIPTIQDAHHAELMLRHYMGEQWRDEQLALIDQLVEQPGAFVREVALHARMLAAHEHKTEVTMDMLEQSITTLLRQIRADADFLQDRRPISMVGGNRNKRTNPFGWRD
ncbi:MAG: hypothetical protein KC547_14430, partial [Anaerolineae bacterium]|nr:hypothetical protein [Anaerolineae bacterium]